MEYQNVLVGISGGIAVYKVCDLVSQLSKRNKNVKVIMTEHAAKFVGPVTFEALSHNPVAVQMFDEGTDPIPHITLAQWADVFILAPATANVIAKAVHGMADDLLSSTMLALTCPKIMCPAMNTHMLENPATVRNIAQAEKDGWNIVMPEYGHLACMESGKGRLPKTDVLLDAIEQAAAEQPLKGLHVLISAGPTQEALDPVRFLSNHSSGKQGYAIAKAAARMGAEVRLVSGPVALDRIDGVQTIPVKSARDMQQAVEENFDWADFIIMAAAVADYRPKQTAEQKIKKHEGSMMVEFVKNPDILAGLGAKKKNGQVLCGFAMETENLEKNARAKLESKNCDLLIANNLTTPGAGFQTDTNVVTMMKLDGNEQLPLLSKEELGCRILKEMMEIRKGK